MLLVDVMRGHGFGPIDMVGSAGVWLVGVAGPRGDRNAGGGGDGGG
jgi:hypothetical protein